MNKSDKNISLLLGSLMLAPFSAHANMGPGAEGFLIMLVNNYLLAFVLIVTLLLTFFKFFSTTLRRNIFVGLNIIPLAITLIGLFLFLKENPSLDTAWLLIPAMFFGHIFSLAIPVIQYRILSKAN